ncbi:hypothetical protein C0992_006620, partial [Termitomyces sp. T32_za158]
PYLEAQGVTNISKLPIGTGVPPLDDPQTFLGAIHLDLYKAPIVRQLSQRNLNNLLTFQHSLPPLTPLSFDYCRACHQRAFTMSYRPKDHYKPHPLLAACPDGMIQLTSIDPNLVVHPLQLHAYIQYDNNVRCYNVTTNTFIPVGYTEFAAAYNASKGDNSCKFTTWDETTSSYNIDNFLIPPSILTFPYCDPCYNDLRVFGLIKPNGDVDATRWDMTCDALLCPY